MRPSVLKLYKKALPHSSSFTFFVCSNMNITTLYADAGRLACRNALQFHCNKLAMQILQISCVCVEISLMICMRNCGTDGSCRNAGKKIRISDDNDNCVR